MELDVSLDLARQGLRTLNENIDKLKEHEVADRLWETLCDSETQKRQKKKAKKYQWYDNSVRELKKSCQAAWFRLKLNVHQEFTPKLQETYKIAKSANKKAITGAKKNYDNVQIEKLVETHRNINAL